MRFAKHKLLLSVKITPKFSTFGLLNLFSPIGFIYTMALRETKSQMFVVFTNGVYLYYGASRNWKSNICCFHQSALSYTMARSRNWTLNICCFHQLALSILWRVRESKSQMFVVFTNGVYLYCHWWRFAKLKVKCLLFSPMGFLYTMALRETES